MDIIKLIEDLDDLEAKTNGFDEEDSLLREKRSKSL